MSGDGLKTILLVEDEAILAMNQSMQLRTYGYNVICVLNGQKAIETVNDSEIVVDLILMDIDLGSGIDGTETAKLIHREHDTPVLFFSSHMEPEIVKRTEDITSYGYVVKNSGITVLDASIKMAFKLHKAYQNLKNQKIEIESGKKELQFFEKRYRRLFESAQDGILILDAESGMIDDVNPFLIKLLGYSKEQFLNKALWDIGAFKNIEYSKQMFKELQEKGYIRYDDLPLESNSGHIIHVEFVSNVYLVDNIKVIQCNIRDTTARILFEKSLTDNIEKTEALLKELQHRSMNSFNMITSLIHLRSNSTQSEEIKNTLNELALRVKSISELYTLLYETDSFYEVQLKTYCDRVIESMFNLTKNIVINKSIAEVCVTTQNAATIGMVLVELLSNAIKYAFPEPREGIINIELKRTSSGIELIIEDNGIGLPDNFNISGIKSMGLHLVNLMVSQLNGKIKFVPGNGTKVIMDLALDNLTTPGK